MFKYLEDDIVTLSKNLAMENFGERSSDAVARRQAEVRGMISVYTDMMSKDFCDYVTNFYKIEEENEEIQQTGSTPD